MRRILAILIVILCFCSCNKHDMDTTLCFIGDSMIANWDLERYFPNRMVENKGIDGIGIEDLDAISLTGSTTNVVVLIGTNDLNSPMTNAELDSYVLQYITEIGKLKANLQILVSILPTDDKQKNQRIEYVNRNVHDSITKLVSVEYVNCYDSFLRDGKIKEELTRDGTHLNDYGYMLLTDLVKERL